MVLWPITFELLSNNSELTSPCICVCLGPRSGLPSPSQRPHWCWPTCLGPGWDVAGLTHSELLAKDVKAVNLQSRS